LRDDLQEFTTENKEILSVISVFYVVKNFCTANSIPYAF